ncbi:hypothetical protein [Jiangella anatolica]|uniref:hypothetical protein n=1 Tax=Jiangella anatolica TaxID=2670374 RepID=UPI0011B50D61|nr:hypothetical protein [Jiangella anatolica]
MSRPRWCVVVVRCWVDGEDLKVRMLATGDVEGRLVRGSAAAASEQLGSWLTALLALEPAPDHGTGDEPETPR